MKTLKLLIPFLLTASAFIPGASAQQSTITYTTTGTLAVISGPDNLGLGGTTFTVTNSLVTGQTPISGTQNQYATTIMTSDPNLPNETVPATISLNYVGPNDPGNNIGLTASINVLTLTINVSSTIAVPSISGLSPAAIAMTPLTMADTLTLSSGTSETVYGFSQGTISSSPSANACNFTVAPTSLSFPYTGGAQTLSITGNPGNMVGCTWTASADQPFIQLSATGGTDSGTLTVTTAANPTGGTLAGNISVAGQVIPVSQAGPPFCNFVVSPSNLSFASAGGVQTLTVTASDPSCTWSATTASTFLTLGSTGGTGTGTISVTAAANLSSTPLTGSVTVAGVIVPVNESGAIVCAFIVTPFASFPSSGGSTTLSVVASSPSCAWTATADQTFVTLNPLSGSGNGTVTVSVLPNLASAALTSTLTIAGQSIPLIEAGTDTTCAFAVAPSALNYPAGGGSMTIAIAATAPNCAWNVSLGISWLTPNIQNGSGNGTVTFIAPIYGGTSDRTGVVVVAGVTVAVTQTSIGSCAYMITPNTLTFGNAGGTGTLQLKAPTSTCTFTASSNDPWITVSPTSGTGTTTLTVTVAPNQSIAFLYGSINVAGQVIPISEGGLIGCAFFVTPSSLSFPSTGGIATLDIAATYPQCTWTAVSNVPWLTFSASNGVGNGTVQATAAYNTTTGVLTGTATVGGQTINLTEASGSVCAFTVSSDALIFPDGGGSITRTITANAPTCTWTAVSNLPQITISPTSGTGTGSVTVTLGDNTGGALINATVILAGQTVQVYELGGCALTISQTSFASDVNGGTQSLAISGPSSCSWTSFSNVPWLTVSPSSGVGPATVAVSFASNLTGVDRTGSLSIAGGVVSILQDFTPQTFSDVPPSAYYFDAVNLMSEKGITAGCAPDVYCPDANLTRAQMAIFVVRGIFGNDNFSYSTIPHFNDVPVGAFGFQWIQKLYEMGITSGCGDSNFCPGSLLSRDQLAIFLVRGRLGSTTVFDYPGAAYFSDVPPSYFAFPWIQRLAADNITTGCGPMIYCPTGFASRGQMSVLLLRALLNLLLPASTPIITQVSPNTIGLGQTETIAVTGTNTSFTQGVTSISPIPGVTIGAITVTSPTQLTVSLTASGDAPAEPSSVLVITSGEQAVMPSALTVH